MKAQHLIGLLALLLLTACEKPQPTSEEPTIAYLESAVITYTEAAYSSDITPKKTDIYVFNEASLIDFDTVEDERWYFLRRMFYTSSEVHIIHSPYDTVHNIKLPKGNYRVLVDNQLAITSPKPWDSIQEGDTLRWYHIHSVSVSETDGFVIFDTFFKKEYVINQ